MELNRRQALAGAIFAGAMPLTSSFAKNGDVEGRMFKLPEESAPHARTFMQWPANKAVHDDPEFLKMLRQALARVANAIADFEPVVMLMDQQLVASARRFLGEKVEIWPIPTDDLWCRDSGPTFVLDQQGKLAISHILFNGWGGKQVHAADGRIAERIGARLGVPLFNTGLTGEAGGIESDGAGTLIAHESSWVNANRNREPRDLIEAKLLRALGARKMIWAPGIKDADITDYHIDALARFVKPGTLVIQLPDRIDNQDPWSRAAFETYEILKAATDASGRKFEIVVLPEPRAPRMKSPDFVASYVNYYVCNGAVISAQFGDRETDSEAMAVLKQLYPQREIIALDVDPIGEVGGGIHCATQQQPRV